MRGTPRGAVGAAVRRVCLRVVVMWASAVVLVWLVTLTGVGGGGEKPNGWRATLGGTVHLVAWEGLAAADPVPDPGQDSQPPPAVVAHPGQREYKIKMSSAYVANICLDSGTKARNHDTHNYCSGWKGAECCNFSLWVPYTPGDKVTAYIYVRDGPDSPPIDVSAENSCVISGTIQAEKFDCDAPLGGSPAPVVVPSLQEYDPMQAVNAADGKPIESALLDLLAWAVSACGVVGVMITGLNMSIQLRRGFPGEFGDMWRHGAIVIMACLMAMTAGPLVATLNLPLP